MADRTIKVYLQAQVADFKRQMDEAAKASEKARKKTEEVGPPAQEMLGHLTKSAQQHREAWDRAGMTLTAFGAATVAALGFATKAAMDWESAWAGVAKTVDGTDAELAAVEEGLRELARTLPATHQEIAATAEAAGQLGVATGDVVAFTKVMIDLSETTNLSADEAATSIAQLMNVMQTAPDDVDNLGASLVALGNNGASTERDIIQMAQRIAGSGKIIGLTEGEVMGLANALSSVGIEVEAGGSAVSKIMTDIAKSVSSGSDDLTRWAAVAGMSAADFAAAWKAEPAEALASFVEGLGRLNAQGGDVFSTLSDLGQSDVRVSRALLSMANAGDLLRESLALGNAAWTDNTALVAEAEKRYDTAEAKVQIAWNNIRDAAISAGESILPAVAGIADAVAGLAGWFAQLPAPVQQAGFALGGLAGTVSLAAGGFLLMFPRVIETVQAFKQLQAANAPLAAGLGKVGRAAGIVGSAIAVMTASSAIPKWGVESSEGAATTAKALLEVASGAKSADEAFASMMATGSFKDWFTGNEIDSIEKAWQTLKDPGVSQNIDNIASSLLTFGQTTSTNRLQSEELFASLDEGLSSLVHSGAADDAAEALAALGIPIEYQTELLPLYSDALAAVDVEQLIAGESAEGLAGAVGEIGPAAQEAADAAREAWRDMVVEASASFVDTQAAYDDAISKNREWAEATAEATTSSQDSWEDYYDGFSVSAEDYIAQLQEQVAAQENWHANLTTLTARVRDSMTGDMEIAAHAMIDELTALGPEGAAQVELLKTMTDEQLAQVVDLWTRRGNETGEGFTSGVEAARSPVVTVQANTDLAAGELAGVLSVIDTAQGTVDIDGYDGPLEDALSAARARIDEAEGTVTIYGDDGEAVTTLTDFTSEVDDSGGTVTIRGNDAEGRSTVASLTNWISTQGAPVKVTVDTSEATSKLYAFLNEARSAGINSPSTYIEKRALGGPIFGAGSETSDSIHAMLSHNEHVWSAAEVKGAGGHGAVAAMRAAARVGALPGSVPGFANGGSPGFSASVAGGPTVAQVAFPDVMRLDQSTVDAIAHAVLAGARDVSAQTLSSAQRSAGGSRQTRGSVW